VVASLLYKPVGLGNTTIAPLTGAVPEAYYGSSDHPGMLLSIIYAVAGRVLDAPTVVVRPEITKDVELLV
jgi:hypothetical protein